MTTSVTTIAFNPDSDDAISATTFAYVRARFRQEMYNVIISEYRQSGITQAQLAKRLGKDPTSVSRWFSGPGNLTSDTTSDILFAIRGGVPKLQVLHPLAQKAGRCLDFKKVETKLVSGTSANSSGSNFDVVSGSGSYHASYELA